MQVLTTTASIALRVEPGRGERARAGLGGQRRRMGEEAPVERVGIDREHLVERVEREPARLDAVVALQHGPRDQVRSAVEAGEPLGALEGRQALGLGVAGRGRGGAEAAKVHALQDEWKETLRVSRQSRRTVAALVRGVYARHSRTTPPSVDRRPRLALEDAIEVGRVAGRRPAAAARSREWCRSVASRAARRGARRRRSRCRARAGSCRAPSLPARRLSSSAAPMPRRRRAASRPSSSRRRRDAAGSPAARATSWTVPTMPSPSSATNRTRSPPSTPAATRRQNAPARAASSGSMKPIDAPPSTTSIISAASACDVGVGDPHEAANGEARSRCARHGRKFAAAGRLAAASRRAGGSARASPTSRLRTRGRTRADVGAGAVAFEAAMLERHRRAAAGLGLEAHLDLGDRAPDRIPTARRAATRARAGVAAPTRARGPNRIRCRLRRARTSGRRRAARSSPTPAATSRRGSSGSGSTSGRCRC